MCFENKKTIYKKYVIDLIRENKSMRTGKSFFIWLGIFVALSLMMSLFSGDIKTSSAEKIAFSDFMSKVEDNQISEVVISGANINGVSSNGSKFYTYAPYDPTMVENLRNSRFPALISSQ